MNCPKCNKAMQRTSRQITHNGKAGKDLKEYDKLVYHCLEDDVWLVVETPMPVEIDKRGTK